MFGKIKVQLFGSPAGPVTLTPQDLTSAHEHSTEGHAGWEACARHKRERALLPLRERFRRTLYTTTLVRVCTHTYGFITALLRLYGTHRSSRIWSDRRYFSSSSGRHLRHARAEQSRVPRCTGVHATHSAAKPKGSANVGRC